jgi:hypothetical protein
MTVPREYLESIASGFSPVLSGSSAVTPGNPVKVKLLPSATEGIRATDLIDGSFNLTWISKNVRFNNFNTESVFNTEPFVPADVNALLAGGMPARVPVVGNLVGTQELQGVPGALSQLAGTFPIAVEVPVSVSVAWSVIDTSGNMVPESPGTFSAPGGLASPEVTFLFVPQTVELTNSAPVSVVRFFIRATVTVTVAGTPSVSRALPDIPVDILAIPTPAVIVFFLHRNFAAIDGDDEGAAFIVVPNNSPLRDLSQLQPVLNTLESTVSSLSSIAGFATFLLGLNELNSALAAQPHVQFRVADLSNNFDNFNDVTLKHNWGGWLFGWTNTEAEDELSSLIFIGPQGKMVSCYNARDRGLGEGKFDLTIGPSLYAIIRNLHSPMPVSQPVGDEINVTHDAPRGLIGSEGSFGDTLSSLRFL